MTHTVILFDFFGVFCSCLASDWFKKNVPDHNTKQSAFQALCTRSDLGQLSRADFNVEASRLTGIAVPDIVQGIEAETAINTQLVTYAQELKTRGYRIACLSNGSHEWTLQVINEHGLGELFEAIMLSSDVGIVKPDPEIYTYALSKLQIAAPQAIFVDDRKTNIEGAEACGIRSIIFSDTPRFKSDLEKVLVK